MKSLKAHITEAFTDTEDADISSLMTNTTKDTWSRVQTYSWQKGQKLTTNQIDDLVKLIVDNLLVSNRKYFDKTYIQYSSTNNGATTKYEVIDKDC